jgi:glucose/arabinose dehydrogenase
MRYFPAIAFVLAAASAGAQNQPPGQRLQVSPAEMPRPYATPSVSNPPAEVQRPPGANLRVPPGFRATIFADGLRHPRWLAVAANGDVLLAESRAGRITLLRDADGDGHAETRTTLIDGLDRPHGMAIQRGHLYIGEPRRIVRIAWQPGDMTPRGPVEQVTPSGALGDGWGHWTRDILFSRDGKQFFVAVGSRSNIQEEAAPRATVQRFNADGTGQTTFASGLRNAVGIAFRPGTEELYAVVNERDGLGDGLVPDYLARVQAGEFYGWPYAYIGANPDPDYGNKRPELVARTKLPDVLFRSHSAPLGLTFYDGEQFPADYRGDAFIGMQGSWNAAKPEGYMVARVPFENGKPKGYYEVFASGFWLSGGDKARIWGRPIGVAVAKDGSLLVADETGLVVWRIAYGR